MNEAAYSPKRLQPARWAVVIVSALAMVLTLLVFVLPVPPDIYNPWYLLKMALSVAAAVLQIGGAYIFLLGLSRFKTGLRRAYLILVLGFMLYGAAQIQLPVIGYFNLWNEWWLTSGLVMVPYALSAILIYSSAYRLAKLLSLRSVWARPWVVFGLAAVTVVLGVLAAPLSVVHEPGWDKYIGLTSWCTVLITATIGILAKIARTIGATYVQAMSWLAMAMGAVGLAAWHELVTAFLAGHSTWYVLSGATLLPLLLGGAMIVGARYVFNTIDTHIAKLASQEHSAGRAMVDAIILIAGLVSNPREVEPSLNVIRAFTAKSAADGAIAEDQMQKLIGAYRDIETHLMSHDPLRTYSSESLRLRLDPATVGLIDERDEQGRRLDLAKISG